MRTTVEYMAAGHTSTCRNRRKETPAIPAMAPSTGKPPIQTPNRVTGGVIDELFVQGLAGALRDPAMDLALDEHLVGDGAAVIHGDVADEPRLACLDVDFHHGDMTTERKRLVGLLELRFGHEGCFG